MAPTRPAVRPRSSAVAGALAFALLVAYASLYPFSGWRWPPGEGLLDLLSLPWPRNRLVFDLWANLLGYVPLGALVYLGITSRRRALVAAVLLASLLSYANEVAQHFLPGRHPSAIDWAMNTSGAFVGALLGRVLEAAGWVGRWRAWRTRFFERDSVWALLLLALWPLGLLVPAPVALGQGQIGPQLRSLLADGLDGMPWAAGWHAELSDPLPAQAVAASPLMEAAITALGLLAPCLVAYAVVAPGWRRLPLVGGALALAIGVVTLSTALNFGPEHALAWWAPSVTPGLVVALALLAPLAITPRRVAAGVGLIVITSLVALVALVPADPYYAQSLSAWEQGRFIHLHGIARWVGWLWPYAALLWLLTRLGARA